jgi:endonuclease/exonuclease/phosphatase family metal-dependent hydrolase
VLVGDLDAAPEASSIRFLRGLQSLGGASVCYRDAWPSVHPDDPGHTFTQGEDPARRIDYVFVRCDTHGPTLAIRGCDLAFSEPRGDVWASDHFGVLADLG